MKTTTKTKLKVGDLTYHNKMKEVCLIVGIDEKYYYYLYFYPNETPLLNYGLFEAWHTFLEKESDKIQRVKK